jgi:endoglucanase
MIEMTRRAALATLAGATASAAAAPEHPRWYGFNLLEYFSTDADWMKYFPYRNDGHFHEDDFRFMRDWGFNWARLPMDYRFWTSPDLKHIDEKRVEPIDRAVKLGEKYGVHVNVALHRAPGYCCLDTLDPAYVGIGITPEKLDLYTSAEAQEAFIAQWRFFAARYKGIASKHVSFDLVNEPLAYTSLKAKLTEPINSPAYIDRQRLAYTKVARATLAAVREIDPGRLVISDGFAGAQRPLPEMTEDGIVQSARGYAPSLLTHHKCEWARRPDQDGKVVPPPEWPLKDDKGNVTYDREKLERLYDGWADAGKHTRIHVGEMGCYKRTPPKTVYAWYEDVLSIFNQLGWGYALWNFRGPFGVLDTERAGTQFESFHGHQLDRTLLTILQRHARRA